MAYPDEWNDVLKERDQLRAENERLRTIIDASKAVVTDGNGPLHRRTFSNLCLLYLEIRR